MALRHSCGASTMTECGKRTQNPGVIALQPIDFCTVGVWLPSVVPSMNRMPLWYGTSSYVAASYDYIMINGYIGGKQIEFSEY